MGLRLNSYFSKKILVKFFSKTQGLYLYSHRASEARLELLNTQPLLGNLRWNFPT